MADELPPSPQLVKIDFRPGIDKEITSYSNEGGWVDGDMVRFRSGKPEKIGGWVNVNGTGDDDTFSGVARNLWNWNSLDGFPWVAIGTHTKLQLWQGEQYYDITPIRTSVSVSDVLNTSANATRIVVSITNHGAITGDSFIVTESSTTVGGNVKVSGEYVVSLIDIDSFAIEANITVTDTSTGTGGLLTGYFLINVGGQDSAAVGGWGAGTWGHDTWDSDVSGASDFGERLRTWSLDNWGEDLVACPRPGGAIYTWDKTSGTDVRAYAVTGSPSENDLILVSQEDRHLIAFGCPRIDTSVYNPLYIRWCASEDFNDWVPSATNDAGDKLLSGANRVVAAQRAAGQILIWTDDHLYGMQFIGPPYTYSFKPLGVGCGLLGPNAMIQVGGRTFWMADQKFMVYDGAAPRPLKCTVLRHVFDDLNLHQLDKICAASNAEFNEVLWFYQSGATDTEDIDSVVSYNYLEDTWAVGTLSRTAWSDRSVFGQPVAAALNRKLYFHEIGHDADGSALPSFIESADMDLGDGEQIMFLDRVIPDFSSRAGTRMEGDVDLYIKYRKSPGSLQRTKGPFHVSAATARIRPRCRARQMAVRIYSNDLGQSWRLGTTRFALSPDGEN